MNTIQSEMLYNDSWEYLLVTIIEISYRSRNAILEVDVISILNDHFNMRVLSAL